MLAVTNPCPRYPNRPLFDGAGMPKMPVSRGISAVLVGLLYLSCILIPALFFAAPARAEKPPFNVQVTCVGKTGGFEAKSGSSIGLEYRVEATRSEEGPKGKGRLAVRLSFSDSRSKPHEYVLTGLKGKRASTMVVMAGGVTRGKNRLHCRACR